MITLTCTNCKARLQMDDAFAGGACRCRYCGTIQTVPSHLKELNDPTGKAKPGKAQVSKALIKQNLRAEGIPSSGLDELADAVSSSGGLIGSGLRSGRLRADTIAPANPRRKMLAMAGGAGAAVLLVVLVVWLIVIGMSAPPPTLSNHPPITSTGATTGTSEATANFCGVPLEDRVVVYVLDRGSATGEVFGDLKEACFRSVESLGPDRKFQIIFWDNGSEVAYPRTTPTFATNTNLDLARRALEDVNAHGQTDASRALKKAFASNPGAVVLATGKAYELDEAFVRMVNTARKDSRARVYTFALGSGQSGAALQAIAASTGGQFRAVSASALREYRD